MGAILTPAIDAIRQIDHPAAEAAHAALLGALASKALRLQPADVSQRPAFDPDYGHYTGHPLDPRTPEPDENDPEAGADMAIDLIGRACRALTTNKAAAADLLREAAALLGDCRRGGSMSAAKHTPGPWIVATSNSWRRIVTCGMAPVCEPITQRDGHPDLHFRNGGADGPDARLIAAAPDLLAALQVIAADSRWLSGEPTLFMIRAAIARATGAAS